MCPRCSGGWCACEEVCTLCVHIVHSLRCGHVMKWLGCILGERGVSLGRGVCGERVCLLSEVRVHGTACSPCARAEVRVSAEMSVLHNEVNIHCVDTSVGIK